MSKNTLDNLFGSKARVKILKFLFRNYPKPIGMRELARHVQEPMHIVQREMRALHSIRVIKKK